MKFPLQVGASKEGIGAAPGTCGFCHKPGAGEPNDFAYVNAGALLKINGNSYAPDDRIKAFFTIGFHASHASSNNSASVEIVENPAIAQFEFYFCSTACLRGFFSRCVDELENKLQAGT